MIKNLLFLDSPGLSQGRAGLRCPVGQASGLQVDLEVLLLVNWSQELFPALLEPVKAVWPLD